MSCRSFSAGLPVPLPLVFALIFFFGTIISGSNAIISLCLPMAMAAVPDGGVALLVLLMEHGLRRHAGFPHPCVSVYRLGVL